MNDTQEISVYTAITGSRYDTPLPQAIPSEIPRICFCDVSFPRQAAEWSMRGLCETAKTLSAKDGNRIHKILLFDGIRAFCRESQGYSVYIDGNIVLRKGIVDVVNIMAAKKIEFAFFRHPSRDTIQSEIQACIEQKRLSDDERIAAFEFLRSEQASGFRDDAGLSANFILIRKCSSSAVSDLMAAWWATYCDGVKRDQISLIPLLVRSSVKWGYVDDFYGNGSVYSRLPHGDYHSFFPVSAQAMLKRVRAKLEAFVNR